MAAESTAQVIQFPDLKPSKKRELLSPEAGTQFDVGDRLFNFYGNGDVFDYGEWASRDMGKMLDRDGQAGALEAALTLPLRQADRSIEPSKGDTGEADFVSSVLMEPHTSGGMQTPIGEVIGQVTGAQIYKKSFFEKVWEIRDDGKATYGKLAWRPTATCELKRNAQTAAMDGFRQQVWLFGGQLKVTKDQKTPGYVDIPKVRSFVYINGKHRNPLSGVSEMEIPYWCYQTKMKLLFLWFQFLEQQALPKVIMYGQTDTEAGRRADDIASMRSSGVVGFQRSPAGFKDFEILESSGKGADQFMAALTFLETWQTTSCLAGFMGLSSLASLGKGSLALSQDQSSFFLKSRQAISGEMAEALTHDVIAPLVALNFGSKAAFPSWKFGQLTDQTSENLVTLFQTMVTAPALQIPNGFLDLIAAKLAVTLNLDQSKVQQVIDQGAKDRAAAAEQAAQQAQQQPPPPGAPVPLPPPAAKQLGSLAGGVNAAHKLAKQALAASQSALAS